ncbi:MAG TPA: hypothetical protein VEC76_18500 [Streptosporangiaceae bacterium]|nr:hypothetical protein [Streptosporangiaceae bacterium]
MDASVQVDEDQILEHDHHQPQPGRMGATTVEGPANHLAMLSHPDAVVTLIKMAADAVPAGN